MTGNWREKYEQFQSLLKRDGVVANAAIHPRWIEGKDNFWYERETQGGTEYRLVDAATGRNTLAFTFEAAAAALAKKFDAEIDRDLLMLRNTHIQPDLKSATFEAFGQPLEFHFADSRLVDAKKTTDPRWLVSPDGKSAAFERDNNLWLREIESGAERALTQDGSQHNSYGDVPSASRYIKTMRPQPPEAKWSPDSRHLLTLQTDDRHVPDLSVTSFVPADGSIRPQVSSNKTSLPADAKPTEFRMLAVEVASGRQIEARYPRLNAVRMNDTPFAAGLTWWSKDGKTAYFVDIERGEKAAHVVAFDVATGASRVVLTERSDTYVELGVNVYTSAFVYALPETSELVWYSERTGRGHLYLYDLVSGALKHPITSGEWQVREVLHVDAKRREVFLLAGGIAKDEDPYFMKPAIAPLDKGNGARVVSGEPGNHTVWRPGEFGLMAIAMHGGDPARVSGVAPSGNYFVETVGTGTSLPKTVLRRRDGEDVALIETAEAVGLPKGWQWPEAVTLKAADGVTDVYGLLFKPPGYDPGKSYPMIDHIYGGPQVSYVTKGAFTDFAGTSVLLETAGFASLGAFALILDGRGTANRERDFRTASHGAAHTASNLEDHMAAIRQLAERYPGLDLNRVGITGFSGGGYMTAIAALRFGDFFKVAVAGGGNYDQALFWHSWGERYHGPYDPDHYARQAAKTYAGGLKGKLLLIHGLMDSGCHPAALFQLTQRLIEENKDFDQILLPKAGHELTGYGTRRRLDFFVRHLFGETPPEAIAFKLPSDDMLKKFTYNAAPPAKRSAAA